MSAVGTLFRVNWGGVSLFLNCGPCTAAVVRALNRRVCVAAVLEGRGARCDQVDAGGNERVADCFGEDLGKLVKLCEGWGFRGNKKLEDFVDRLRGEASA